MEQQDFLNFYEKHRKQVFRFVFYRVGGSRELAEDLTQEVFLKAFQAFERFDPSRATSAWILTIARNHLINHINRSPQHASLEDFEGTLSASKDLRERFATNQEEQLLLDTIATLPEEEAKLIRMKYLEGWSYEELSPEFGKTPGTLRVRASRAFKMLRDRLKGKISL
jgi:RNA polymerase sigma-70 factor (ECF subfamily)